MSRCLVLNGMWSLRYQLPTTKTRNPSGNILYNHVRHVQNNDVLDETWFDKRPETSEQGIQASWKTVLPALRGIFEKMQIPRVEDMVTRPPEDSPGKNKTILQKKTGRPSDNTWDALCRALPFWISWKWTWPLLRIGTAYPVNFTCWDKEHRLTENVRPGDLEDMVIVPGIISVRAGCKTFTRKESMYKKQ
jgi:hypothetical protein